jgi:transposase InsO family protein
MDLARYVVDAVVLDGRSYREVARAHGVSKSWVGKVLGRFREGGYEAIAPRSRAARRIPHRTPEGLEDEIVALRKELTELGVDAGAQTIHYHLGLRHARVPSVSTIWRVLRRRGFVVPEPHKRPRSSWIRFEATLPNECWQSDVTHVRLDDGRQVEIVNFIDDHSRLAVAARVMATATAPKVLEVFREAGARWGLPAALLTDNGCVYTTWHRGGPNVMQTELLAAGIDYRHSRPYHPQTCGKVARFHQTMKAFLVEQPAAGSIGQLQTQVDRFVAYYNEVRPHRATGRKPPRVAFDARDKARPCGPKIRVGAGVRVRRDRIDKGGKVTLRHGTRLHHIGVGHAHKGKRVTLLVHGLDVRVISEDGELLRQLTLESHAGLPTPRIVRLGYDAPTHPATMVRHITWWALEDLNL